MDVLPSHLADVAGLEVRRALPHRPHRTVGAWCFLDHFGPATGATMSVGPHPHIGLQTVTWLLAGEVVHRDNLGSEQTIRPGQLNLMTSGRGISHSEESPAGAPSELHGVQLWVALPESTRHGDGAFEHHDALPRLEVGPGVSASVLVGTVDDTTSPARADTPHVGVELTLHGGASSTVPLDPAHEHAVVVLAGAIDVGGRHLEPGALGYLAPGRDELPVRATGETTAMLIGGLPFPEEIHMWWNFVARSHAEVDVAADDWNAASDRFGEVASTLARISSPTPPWRSAR